MEEHSGVLEESWGVLSPGEDLLDAHFLCLCIWEVLPFKAFRPS